MPDKDLLKVKVSRIIPADKSRVIRLVSRVEEFPSYIPTVKSVRVLHRGYKKVRTQWRVQVDGVQIAWVEDEVFTLAKDTISFEAIKGDIETFKGEWKFKKHPQGTMVVVQVGLKVGIPGIKEFADAYVKKLVAKNFEAILAAMERRLISMRYKSYRMGESEDKIAGFGVIGHFYNYVHMQKALRSLNPKAKMPSRRFLSQLFSITPSFKVYDIENFRSKNDQVTNGCFIVATFIPDMVETDIWSIFSKVVRACKIAERQGVGIVTLGGFASIVAERLGCEISNEVDVAVTSGNTFTAVMAVDGIFKAMDILDVKPLHAKLAIIGGTGDIGSACARSLVGDVAQVTITGRTKANLRHLRNELAKKKRARVLATTDNRQAVRDADIVIAAASASTSIVDINWFKPGAIICDVGYPKNVSYNPTKRRDILIFSGGLSTTPTPVRFPVDTGLPRKQVLYGCFAEAIILALERRYENYSFGRGNITIEKMREIRRMGRKHGFTVSDFYWGNKIVTKSMLESVKKVIHG